MAVSNKPMLLEVVRQRIRLKHYSHRTENSYVHWIRQGALACWFLQSSHSVRRSDQQSWVAPDLSSHDRPNGTY
jgi:hypothetical protein